jgi:hypothetical protein
VPAVGYYVADNGFCGRERHLHWRDDYGATVISPPQRTQSTRPWPRPWRRWLASIRQMIETVREKLLYTFGFDRHRPKCLQGLQGRPAATACLHNSCIRLNLQLGRNRLAFADLLEWQHR